MCIAAGAGVNSRDNSGQTALMVMAKERNYDILTGLSLLLSLIAAGAQVNMKDENGRTALMGVVERKGIFDAKDHVTALIEAGAEVNLQDNEGRTALMRARQGDPAFRCVSALIEAGANANMQDKAGRTALMDAAEWEQAPCVSALIESGANVNLQDEDGRTALSNASERGDWAAVSVIIGAGAKVNLQDKTGRTALVYVVERRFSIYIVSTLVKAGVHVNVKVKGRRELLAGMIPLWSQHVWASYCDDCYMKPLSCVLHHGHHDDEYSVAKFFCLLVAAGEKLDPKWFEDCGFWKITSAKLKGSREVLKKFVFETQSSELGLQRQCRTTIRRHLLSVSGVNLFHQVERLPLPRPIKTYLTYDVRLSNWWLKE